MKFQEIPHTWLIAGLGIGLIAFRCFGFDTWTTAALSSLMGYLVGSHLQKIENSPFLYSNLPESSNSISLSGITH